MGNEKSRTAGQIISNPINTREISSHRSPSSVQIQANAGRHQYVEQPALLIPSQIYRSGNVSANQISYSPDLSIRYSRPSLPTSGRAISVRETQEFTIRRTVEYSSIPTANQQLSARPAEHLSSVEDKDRNLRQMNVIIFGLEDYGNANANDVDNVNNMLKIFGLTNKLSISKSIAEIRRLGKYTAGKKRPLRQTFNSLQERNLFLSYGKLLRQFPSYGNVQIREDFTELQRQQHRR